MIGGIAAALAGGAFLGLAASSNDGAIGASRAEATATPLQVELAALPPPPTAKAGARLDVRPDESARAQRPRSSPDHHDGPEARERQTPPSARDDGAEESEVLDVPPGPEAPPEDGPLGA
ncbi:MAG: hypothetical protein AB1942_02090 [Pseudomonadota bacterium]